MPGFDENLFAVNANGNSRLTADIIKELKSLRTSSVIFIESLIEKELEKTGTANGYQLSVRLLVNHLYGHHKHHINIIEEKYL